MLKPNEGLGYVPGPMKTLKTLILSALLSNSFQALAQEGELSTSVEKQASAEATKWKASAYTYYFDFEGTRPSDEAQYFFDDANLAMQVFTLQYQYSPAWTFQVMGTHLDNYVETNLAGTFVKDRTTGFGDTQVTAITPLHASSDLLVLGHVGVSLPTGGIDYKNPTGMMPDTNYAYNMQAGSGTFDTVTGLTTMTFQGPVQAGTHLSGLLRNGRNSNGYALGNQYRADAWLDYNTKLGLTPRLVGYYKHKDPVQGRDEKYERLRDNQAIARYYEFYHHNQVNWDVSAALKYSQNVGPVSLAAEVGVPVAQDSFNYDNAAVSTEYYGTVNVSGAF